MTVGDNPGNGTFDNRRVDLLPAVPVQGRAAGDHRAWPTRVGVRHHASRSRSTGRSPRATLIRPAAVTHSSDPNQRFVDLPMTVNGNNIGLNVTSNPNIAPPGWYMLFVIDANGVPSVAKWVKVG